MIYSMTAFARRENRGPWGELICELRSVNHRYLDVSVRLPEELRPLETAARGRIRDTIGRGKIECYLRYSPPAGEEAGLRVDFELAGKVVAAAEEIAGLLSPGKTAPGKTAGISIDAMDILRWPNVVQTPAPSLDAITTPMLNVLDETLAELMAMRLREGEKLSALITARCVEVSAILGSVRERLPAILSLQRARLLDRFAEIQVEPNPDRLEQEMVLFAQKMDVAEELDRLDTHLTEVEYALRGGAPSGKKPSGKNPPEKKPREKNPVGRRLDFLIQEMHREANTLSAKSVDKVVSSASVELRVFIEQMREQVQNVE